MNTNWLVWLFVAHTNMKAHFQVITTWHAQKVDRALCNCRKILDFFLEPSEPDPLGKGKGASKNAIDADGLHNNKRVLAAKRKRWTNTKYSARKC